MADPGRAGAGIRAATPAPDVLALPPTSLPKGGGAIRGIAERFATNPVPRVEGEDSEARIDEELRTVGRDSLAETPAEGRQWCFVREAAT